MQTSEFEMNAIGRTIVGFRTPDMIMLAADSKVVSDGSTKLEPQNIVPVIQDVFLAFGGLRLYRKTEFNIGRLAVDAIKAETTLAEKLRIIEGEAKHRLSSTLSNHAA